jgi:predicted transcriptional regulator
MRKRKIDDEQLLKLLSEGKNQKQAAAILKVSEPAVCKRLKRLLPAPDTPTFNGLTDKEKRFVVEKAKGKGNIQAVMASYEVTSRESAKVIGSQLMGKPEVEMAITELMNYHGLTKSYRVQKLKNHVDNRDPNVSLKALDQSFKLDGSYSEKTERPIQSLTFIVIHSDGGEESSSANQKSETKEATE